MDTGNVNQFLYPPIYSALNDVNIGTLSAETVGLGIAALRNSFTSTSVDWTANRLIFLPLLLVRPTLVDQFWWINSDNTPAGNADAGVYTFDGQTKLVSCGSTVVAGSVTVLQAAQATNTILPANQLLWLAFGCDSGTMTFLSSQLNIAGMALIGIREQLSGWSSGLPATITLDAATIAVTPLFGFSGRSVI